MVKREGRGGTVKPLVVAGGAGGDASKCGDQWCNARIDELNQSTIMLNNAAAGGTTGSEMGGGAGFLAGPVNSEARGPKCFADGMTGEQRNGFSENIIQISIVV